MTVDTKVVLLEYINPLQLNKQSTAIIWVGLSPATLTLSYTVVINNADVIVLYIEISSILNSYRW